MTLVQQFPLSKSQSLIWTGQGLQPKEPLYNMVLAFRIAGKLDPRIFQRAFQSLIDESDAMRTVFKIIDGTVYQQVLDRFTYEVEIIDCSGDRDLKVSAEAWIAERKLRNFELSESLFDCALLKINEEYFIWYLNQHHLITDAWAVSVIFRKVNDNYTALIAGTSIAGAAMPAYQDYIEYESKHADSRAFLKATEFWRVQNSVPRVTSNFYRATPSNRRGRTERIACDFGAQRSAKLRALAERDEYAALTRDMSHFQIFMTVLFAYLFRICGNRDIAVGTPAHNRGKPSHKETVGLFIEVYPLRIRIDEDETFASLYKQVARATKKFLLNAQPGATSAALNRSFDVLLNYITASFPDFAGIPTVSDWIHADHGDVNHLLRLQIHDFDNAEEFALFFDLNVDTFVGAEREWVGEHFLCLFDAYVHDPQAKLDAVSLFENAGQARIENRNDIQVTSTIPNEGVLGAFERHANLLPDKPALMLDGRATNYGDLNARANQIAHCLAERDIGSGVRVAIVLERSPEAVAAILGVLKAGAAYVPIDPNYPGERIAFICEDADAAAILTTSHIATSANLDDRVLLTLDAENSAIDAQDTDDLNTGPAQDDDAYVIYTSGSTGNPKGVIVTHRSLANYVQWAVSRYVGDDLANFPLFSSISFDLTLTSIFVPLVSGGQIVIYPESADTRDIVIHRVIEENAVNIIKLTPAHLALLQTMDLSRSRIKTLILGGEDLKTDLARTISKYFGDDIAIYNEYGPTEATVGCMVHRYDPKLDCDASVPIGGAIENMSVSVRDRNGGVLPAGVAGEICISGIGLAQGYLKRKEETAARFVEDPTEPGSKMYRTGDRGRRRADGILEYLGREDDQIKIRGVRIELGEIENALLGHDGISACAVAALDWDRHSGISDHVEHCVRCGLESNHPDAQLDDEIVCRACRRFEREREISQSYFRTLDDLKIVVSKIRERATNQQDCIALLSGGKDSTYALCQLVDHGLTPLVFTLDNGFISDGAKENIRKVVDLLGLELVVGTTSAMNEIFVDSLNRHSNVCNGCFKTIYTLSMNLARERGIQAIFTGLSRGQIFETRIADLFKQNIYDTKTIDRTIIEARKAYHRMDDAVSRRLDVEIFTNDAVFEEIEFVDFYRYCDVTLDDVYAYLGTRVPWVRPADTGRSTNCLINESGIYVHKRERGFHNYALPYSWDVRLGHKQRDAALAELDDDIDVENVNRVLREIGYTGVATASLRRSDRFLVAYYVSDEELSADSLRDSLSERLPAEYIPRQFMRLEALPLTTNGKIDRAALPRPDDERPELEVEYHAPSNANETHIATAWQQMFGIEKIGVYDNFFDLGGDSILNIQIVARLKDLGLALTPQQVFEHPTIAELAEIVETLAQTSAEQGLVSGDVPLTAAQRRYFTQNIQPDSYHQSVLLYVERGTDLTALEEALRFLPQHHDVLRARYAQIDEEWVQQLSVDKNPIEIRRVDFSAHRNASHETIEQVHAELERELCITEGRVISAALILNADAEQDQLLIVIHHLVVDGVSWWILLEDLETAYAQITERGNICLPPKTTSVQEWGSLLRDYATSPEHRAAIEYWQSPPIDTQLPRDVVEGASENNSRELTTVHLNAHETAALLHDVPRAYRTQVPDILLTALANVLSRWASTNYLLVDLEGHGREAIVSGADLSRTVGWFTSVFPIALHYDRSSPLGENLKLIKEQLRAVPNRGVDFGIARYLADDAPQNSGITNRPNSEVLFNYLGQWDQTLSSTSHFSFVRAITASKVNAGVSSYLFEIHAVVFNGRLRIDWEYSNEYHLGTTVEKLNEDLVAEIRALIQHCLATKDAVHTPSDFPGADLSQAELDEILDNFGEALD